MSHACGVSSAFMWALIRTAQQALYPPSLSLAHIVYIFQMCFTVKLSKVGN